MYGHEYELSCNVSSAGIQWNRWSCNLKKLGCAMYTYTRNATSLKRATIMWSIERNPQTKSRVHKRHEQPHLEKQRRRMEKSPLPRALPASLQVSKLVQPIAHFACVAINLNSPSETFLGRTPWAKLTRQQTAWLKTSILWIHQCIAWSE